MMTHDNYTHGATGKLAVWEEAVLNFTGSS